TGKKVTFEPMPSYERKVIHNVLANRVDIETHSEGTEPNRYLVIEPVR
ncbi:protein jag, partial [Shigella dysenteriae]|nr:protein jag [Shigella dysenteriae]